MYVCVPPLPGACGGQRKVSIKSAGIEIPDSCGRPCGSWEQNQVLCKITVSHPSGLQRQLLNRHCTDTQNKEVKGNR